MRWNGRSTQVVRWTGLALGLAVLLGCQRSIDQPLTTGGGQAAFEASLQDIYPSLTAKEQEAFRWATADYDLAGLHRDYPGATPRQIIHGKAQQALAHLPDRIREVGVLRQQQDVVARDLANVAALDPQFHYEPADFGEQPTIKATLVNRSSRDIGKARWHVALFLDGSRHPVAEATVLDDYRRRGGLPAGGSLPTAISLGMEFGDGTWKTLEIKQARTREISLQLIPESVLDYGNKPYLQPSVEEQLGELKALEEKLQAYAILYALRNYVTGTGHV